MATQDKLRIDPQLLSASKSDRSEQNMDGNTTVSPPIAEPFHTMPRVPVIPESGLSGTSPVQNQTISSMLASKPDGIESWVLKAIGSLDEELAAALRGNSSYRDFMFGQADDIPAQNLLIDEPALLSGFNSSNLMGQTGISEQTGTMNVDIPSRLDNAPDLSVRGEETPHSGVSHDGACASKRLCPDDADPNSAIRGLDLPGAIAQPELVHGDGRTPYPDDGFLKEFPSFPPPKNTKRPFPPTPNYSYYSLGDGVTPTKRYKCDARPGGQMAEPAVFNDLDGVTPGPAFVGSPAPGPGFVGSPAPGPGFGGSLTPAPGFGGSLTPAPASSAGNSEEPRRPDRPGRRPKSKKAASDQQASGSSQAPSASGPEKIERKKRSMLDEEDPYACPKCFHCCLWPAAVRAHLLEKHPELQLNKERLEADPNYAIARPLSYYRNQGLDVTYRGEDRKQVNAHRRRAAGLKSDDPAYLKIVYKDTPAERRARSGAGS